MKFKCNNPVNPITPIIAFGAQKKQSLDISWRIVENKEDVNYVAFFLLVL